MHSITVFVFFCFVWAWVSRNSSWPQVIIISGWPWLSHLLSFTDQCQDDRQEPPYLATINLLGKQQTTSPAVRSNTLERKQIALVKCTLYIILWWRLKLHPNFISSTFLIVDGASIFLQVLKDALLAPPIYPVLTIFNRCDGQQDIHSWSLSWGT